MVDPVARSTSDVRSASPMPSLPGVMGELADTMDSLKKVGEKYKRVTVLTPLKKLRDENYQLGEEQLKVLEEARKTASIKNAIGWGNTSVSLIYAGFSIIGGYYSTDERRLKIMGTGVVLLGNTLMQQFNGWSRVSHLFAQSFTGGNEKLEDGLSFALPLVFSAVDFFWGAKTTLAGLLPEQYKKVGQICDQVLSYTSKATSVGHTYASFKNGVVERRKIDLEGTMDANARKVESINQRNESLTNDWKLINDAVKSATKKIIQARTTAAI